MQPSLKVLSPSNGAHDKHLSPIDNLRRRDLRKPLGLSLPIPLVKCEYKDLIVQ